MHIIYVNRSGMCQLTIQRVLSILSPNPENTLQSVMITMLIICVSICLFVYIISLFMYLSIHPSVRPSIRLSIHSSIHHLLTSCYVGHKTNSSQYSWTEFNCVRNSGDVFAIPRRIHKNDCVHIITHKQYDCCNYIRRVWSIDIETSARTR